MTHEALSKSVGPSIVGFVTETPDATEMLQASKYQEGVMSLLLKEERIADLLKLVFELIVEQSISKTVATVAPQILQQHHCRVGNDDQRGHDELPHHCLNGRVA